MKKTVVAEALVGVFVVLGILALVFLAYKVSSVNQVGRQGSYTLYAEFNSVSGLKVGSPVMLSGVKVGQVATIEVSPSNYKARVEMLIDSRYDQLPFDTSVSVLTQGLLGEKYLGLDIGADDEYLVDGDQFDFTKSAIVLERLLDQFFLRSSQGQ
ncbi:outer membrane lipid asymmetry maintenance protein MlaD [Ostreibacterium oceani]|uniref:Outer membrane lipid asymmetry maintenance protein MlaD n=1 Tax=Ostreibacterium oceani TaxID=2654998 RepID=A0A6N7F483_9GAMM|nr:outer membrane lipid asymmetry maintenance protein MlaD [Ostreibacterium oceani]MPV86686.1 outer membrane lipid asymmetry maintenance protein MlaD [Ostreibacterium oceani]